MSQSRTAAPDLTVCICTRDRAASLEVTLESLVKAENLASMKHGADCEILIVDNGSTDDTPTIISRFENRFKRIRHILQPVPGLSNARNAAIDSATGQYLIWTDDDVLVDENWIAAYLERFRMHPDVGIFGGRATPRYEEPHSDWMLSSEAELVGLLALRDNPEWKEISCEHLPFGLNFAVRRDIQLRHRFDPNLGVAPGRRLGGEETSMLAAALAEGARGLWVWDAKVYHRIPTQRQSKEYVFEFYCAAGFQNPKLNMPRDGWLAKSSASARALLWICFNGISASVLRSFRHKAWVRKHIECARWAGTFKRLSA